MAEAERPLLNPVLSLRISPTRKVSRGGGKTEKHIVKERLEQQRITLSNQVASIIAVRQQLRTFAGKTQLLVRMFPDSYAPSHLPDDILRPEYGIRIVAPFRDGYLVEADFDQIPRLARRITTSDTIAVSVDVSRTEAIEPFTSKQVLRGQTPDALWAQAPEVEGGRSFVATLAPFQTIHARDHILTTIMELQQQSILLPTYPVLRLSGSSESEAMLPATTDTQNSLAIAMRAYRNTGVAHAMVRLSDIQALRRVVASGTVFRIDPVRKIEVTTPGGGDHPGPLPPRLSQEPIVGIFDGGRTARTYAQAEAWAEPPLVPTGIADTKHGNRVTALAVHGHVWNTNLPLPQLYCRTGTAQAIPRADANYPPDVQKLVNYIERVVSRHPETRVWNFSFNEVEACDPEEVSYLGDAIARLARRYKFLPVISAGNRSRTNKSRIAPPADCEAALVVGGRKFDTAGRPHGPCDVSLPGPGPQGMLKPDVSWYSTLRVLGGDVVTATSFPTPLISSLAAHSFHNLREATPDLVRALIVNRTDLEEFEPSRGWGSPDVTFLPWNCHPGTVTLAWRGELRPGIAYYWERIPIPKSLIRDGKLYGRGSLTAILEPMTSRTLSGNYFASRLEVALQYKGPGGGDRNLLGTMKTSELPELEARADLHKWNPVRRHSLDFTRNGRSFSGQYLRLYARSFVRDLYQFGMENNEDVAALPVSFVLTLSDGSTDDGLYNEMRSMLGNFVESAVLDQDIDLDVE